MEKPKLISIGRIYIFDWGESITITMSETCGSSTLNSWCYKLKKALALKASNVINECQIQRECSFNTFGHDCNAFVVVDNEELPVAVIMRERNDLYELDEYSLYLIFRKNEELAYKVVHVKTLEDAEKKANELLANITSN